MSARIDRLPEQARQVPQTATGKHVRFSGIYIARITDVKIVEHWGEEDGINLLRQLGFMK